MDNLPVGRGRGRGRVKHPEVPTVSFQETGNTSCVVGRGRGRGVSKTEVPIKPEELVETSAAVIDDKTGQESVFTTPSGSESSRSSVTNDTAAVICESVKDFSSRSLSLQSTETGSTSSSSSKRVTLHYFLPKYFTPTPPSRRLKRLGSCEVKVLKVQSSGHLVVHFQDNDSLERFACLENHMRSFYLTSAGYELRIMSGEYLEVGEIVAARVFTRDSDEQIAFRRVQVTKIINHGLEDGSRRNNFCCRALDIDNLQHWNVQAAFALPDPFYQHPVQACPVRITNWSELYPKELFQPLLPNSQQLEDVMSTVTYNLFSSLIGRNIGISNILESNHQDSTLTAEINPNEHYRLRNLFVEQFCSYFTPVAPQLGEVQEGVVTEVLLSGAVGICMKNSMFEAIDKLLNDTEEFYVAAENVTEEDTRKVVEMIRQRHCRNFVALDVDKLRIVRVEVRAITDDGDEVRVVLMDTGKETRFKTKHLICGMSNNPKIPAMLAFIPPQAIQYQLADIRFLNQTVCKEIYEKCKTGIIFQVTRKSRLRSDCNEIIDVLLFSPEEPRVPLKWENCTF